MFGNKGIKILGLFMVLAGLMTSCKVKESADMAYPNSRYSYEKETGFSCDIWTSYDKEYLTKLREDYKLNELVENCKNDFEKIQAVTKWVTNLWEHNGDNIPEKSDPASILHKVTVEGEQYRCVEYGVVISGCLNALDIPARTIGLKTQDVETREYGAGHVATEAYVRDLEKWVFIDGQWGVIPIMGSTPLNAVQLGEVLEHPDRYEETLDFISFQTSTSQEYQEWIREYLYYLDIIGYYKTDESLQEKTLMLTPIDAKNPEIFQINYPLEIDKYTHSVAEFYPSAV